MEEYSLSDAINLHLPEIDKILEENSFPVFDRVFEASRLFVEIAVASTSIGSKEEFVKSDVYLECIVPPVNNWYWDKYGSLMNKPIVKKYSGLVCIYSQPVLFNIPSTLTKIEEEGKTSWLIFPDHLYRGPATIHVKTPTKVS